MMWGWDTYANNSWVIRHGRRLVLLDVGVILDAKILHIASTEDDVLVDLIRGANLLFRAALPSLSAI